MEYRSRERGEEKERFGKWNIEEEKEKKKKRKDLVSGIRNPGSSSVEDE